MSDPALAHQMKANLEQRVREISHRTYEPRAKAYLQLLLSTIENVDLHMSTIADIDSDLDDIERKF